MKSQYGHSLSKHQMTDAPRVTAYAGSWADHQGPLNSYHPPVPGDEAHGLYLGASPQLSYFTR